MKLNKVLSVIMVVLMLACVSTNVFAAGSININALDGKANLSSEANTGITTIGNTILTFITNVAIILAVVVIAVLGVKYMMGSVEEKAEYKKTMLPYIVGAVLVFGAGAIGKMIIGFASSL